MPDLESYAFQRLSSQPHSWSISDLFDDIEEMCTPPNKDARQLVVTEAARLYSQLPHLAQALHKAVREVPQFAGDLLEVLGQMKGREDPNLPESCH